MSGDLSMRKLERTLRNRVVFANTVGGVLVVAYLLVAAPLRRGEVRPDPLGALAVYGAQVVVLLPVSHAFIAWLFAGLRGLDPPAASEKDRQAILQMPIRMASGVLAAWVFLAIVTAVGTKVLTDDVTVARSVYFALSMLLGGLASTLLVRLNAERALRGLFAAVLRGGPAPRPGVLGVRRVLVLTWLLGSGIPIAGIAAAAFGPRDIEAVAVVLSAIALVTGLAFTLVAARWVADPLADVRSSLARVASGDLGVEVSVDNDGEIGLLQAGVNQMVGGLRERELLRDMFGRHVGDPIVRRALDTGASLRGDRRHVSVLFVDLVGSTGLAESLPPEELVDQLNSFFRDVLLTVEGEGGWINKFHGDGALCVFGAPGDQPDHADAALRAARRLPVLLRGVDCGVGVSSGIVFAGNVGAERRLEYTVIGDAVNEAARLSDLAKSTERRVLASGAIVSCATADAASWRQAETVVLRGRSARTETWEPLSGPLAASG